MIRITDRTDLYPLSHSIGFIEMGFQDGVQGLTRWLESASRNTGSNLDVVVDTLHGPLASRLRDLEPISTWADRILAVPTTSDRWTAWFRNTTEGTDPDSASGFLAQLLGVRTIGIADRPEWGELFFTHAPGRLEAQRWIGCTLQSSRWEFDSVGEPLAWEDTSTYSNRRIQSRFQRNQLDSLCAGYGINLQDSRFFAPDDVTKLLRYVGHKPEEQLFTLANIQSTHGVSANA